MTRFIFKILTLIAFFTAGFAAWALAPRVAWILGLSGDGDAVMYLSLVIFLVLFIGAGWAYEWYQGKRFNRSLAKAKLDAPKWAITATTI